jgi:F-type H+-transporting ATPase subunit b
VSFIPTQFADSTSGIGSLGIDGKALIIQLITFVLAFWVLQHWAFKPIVKIMDERRKTIDDGVKLTEQLRLEKAELDKNVAAQLHAARVKADGIIAEAQDAARDSIRQAEDKARAKADGILKEAQERTLQDIARMRKALEKEIVGLVADATGVIIDEKVDAKKDSELIERAIREQQAV